MVERKNDGNIYFLQLFGMACKLPSDMRFIAFPSFNFHYFISHFVFQSL